MRKKVKKGNLKRLGVVLHLLNNKLIVKVDKITVKKNINAEVRTKEKRKIGRVYDIFGPVNSPYACIKIFDNIKEDELKNLLNKIIYVWY